jgi:AraC-like DNA-binding protein
MALKIMDASSYLELNLKECGREICLPDKEFTYTPKSYHLFHYVASGKGTLVYGDKTYHLHRGDLFYFAPHDLPHYTPDHDDPWSYLWLGFDGTNVKAFLTLAGLSSENPVLHDEEHRYKEFFDAIYNGYLAKGFLDLYCLGQAYALFGLLGEKGHREEKALTLAEAHIKAAKEFVINNYQFALSVEDVANNVGVTPNYLANIFAEYEHSSPKKYLTQVRMENAALLLRSGSYKVNEVGKRCGYQNQLHFSSEFKKYYGASPLHYLKEGK